jgi:hypothetical protein
MLSIENMPANNKGKRGKNEKIYNLKVERFENEGKVE